MQDWPIFRDALECDVFINVPILKHHGITELTLSMKNLMGVCGGNRGLIHNNIGRKLLDLTDFIKPDLTVIDAFRVLLRHGPIGGNLDDVKDMKKIIVAEDPTLADAYASRLLGRDPLAVSYIAEAVKRNFGSIDIKNKNIFWSYTSIFFKLLYCRISSLVCEGFSILIILCIWHSIFINSL